MDVHKLRMSPTRWRLGAGLFGVASASLRTARAATMAARKSRNRLQVHFITLLIFRFNLLSSNLYLENNHRHILLRNQIPHVSLKM